MSGMLEAKALPGCFSMKGWDWDLGITAGLLLWGLVEGLLELGLQSSRGT